MRHLVVKAALFAVLPGISHALSACDAILQLDDLTAAIERVGTPGHRQVTADMSTITQIGRTADVDSILYALGDHPVAANSDTIRALFTNAHDMTNLFAQNRQEATLALANAPQMADLLENSRSMLAPYPCDTDIATLVANALPAQGAGLGVTSPLPYTAKQASIVVVMSLVLAGICAFLIRRQSKRIALKGRQQKRYYIALPAILATNNANIRSTIQMLDISGFGAKIKLNNGETLLPGQKVKIQFDTHTRFAQVQWSNQYFAGLRFQDPMTATQVRRLAYRFRPGKRAPSQHAAA